jgi:hypothetical protein
MEYKPFRNKMLKRYEDSHSTETPQCTPKSPDVNLPSWVPNFSEHDGIEHVMFNSKVRTGPPPKFIRATYPRPIHTHLDRDLYKPNRTYSKNVVDGDITFELTEDPAQPKLGVYGLRVGTVKKVFEMPFTADPSVRPMHT